MKALIARGHGDLSQLEVADVPHPSIVDPGDVLVRLEAAALNHLDLWTLRGLPGLSLEFPHIIGADGAGVVDDAGPHVSRVRPGDRVMINPGISCYQCESCLVGEHSLCESFALLGEHRPGTIGEYVVVPEQNLLHVPELPDSHTELSWPEAAAFSLVTLTAWRMLRTKARVQQGETVLIWGIGGGVSSAALAIAKLAGASVFVTSSSDAKLGAAHELGADVTLNHDSQDVVKEVRALTDKRGVDVVVENVGAATWEQSLQLLARGGRLVTCGATTGPKVSVDVRRMFWHQWTLMGSTMGNAAEYAEIVRVLGQGQLRPVIDSAYPLDRAVDAFHRLEAAEQIGKIVVEIR